MDYNLYYGVKSNRLLIVSNRAPEFTTAVKNTLPGVFVVRYNYDTSSLDDIICMYMLLYRPIKIIKYAFAVNMNSKSYCFRIQNVDK